MNPQTRLLTSKLLVSQLPAMCAARPRLLASLGPGLGGKLTLVSAPAGFGTTTLISEWSQEGQGPYTWRTLDERDNEPARFLAYAGAALTEIDGAGAKSALRTSQLPPPQAIAAALVNEIAASGLDFVFSLDEYHVIANTAIRELPAFLLDHLSWGMYVILINRADPPLPLACLRADLTPGKNGSP